MSAKKNILEIKIDNSVKNRNDLFVKILQSNKEVVDFFKNFSDKDANTLIEIMNKLNELETTSTVTNNDVTVIPKTKNLPTFDITEL